MLLLVSPMVSLEEVQERTEFCACGKSCNMASIAFGEAMFKFILGNNET
jgi:hypothetical protein